jgi:hypothetical protein
MELARWGLPDTGRARWQESACRLISAPEHPPRDLHLSFTWRSGDDGRGREGLCGDVGVGRLQVTGREAEVKSDAGPEQKTSESGARRASSGPHPPAIDSSLCCICTPPLPLPSLALASALRPRYATSQALLRPPSPSVRDGPLPAARCLLSLAFPPSSATPRLPIARC